MESPLNDDGILFHENPLPLLFVDLETNQIIKSNEAASLKFGYPSEDLIKMDLSDLRLAEDRKIITPYQNGTLNSHYFETVSRCVTKTNGNIITSIKFKVINHKNRKIALSVVNDVSLYKSIETRIIQAQAEAIEAEREHIAREIHDGFIQNLVSSSIYLNSINAEINENPELSEKFNLALDILKKGIEEARDFSHNLLPKSIRDLPFRYVIEELVQDFAKTVDMKVDYSVDLKTEDISEKLKINIYRILQESLGNIRKHSRATVAKLKINETKDKIVMSLQDNGVGFDHRDIQQKNQGIGLKNLKRRTALIGGILNIFSEKDMGTRIILRVGKSN